MSAGALVMRPAAPAFLCALESGVSQTFPNPQPILESVAGGVIDWRLATFHLIESTLSHEQIHAALIAGLRTGKPENYYCYIREVYDDYVVYEEGTPQGEQTYRRGYTIDGDGNVTLADAQPVRVETQYVPVSEAVADRLQGGAILESLDADGWNWRIQVIQAGVSINGNEYPLTVLHEAVGAYAGVPAFYGRGKDHNPNERGFDSVAGYVVSPAANPRGIEATLEINRAKPDVREAVRHAWDVTRRTGRSPFGFSHVVPAGGAVVEARQPRGYRVKAISRVESVDLVMAPSAGGALISPLSESLVPDPLQEAIVNVAELLARYRAGTALSQEEWRFLQESLPAEQFTALLAESRQTAPEPEPPAPEPATPNPAPLDEATSRRLADLETALELERCRTLLTRRLTEARLPEPLRQAIDADFNARPFQESELDARITRDRDIASQLVSVRPTGLGIVTVTEDQREKHQQAMDVMLGIAHPGVRGFRTLKEAYLAITGDRRFGYIDHDLNRAVLGEAMAYAGDDALLSESITSSTFAEMLGDSITRRMLREYSMPDRQTWRLISDVVPVMDFRTQRRVRWGGYGLLSVVGEGAPYQNLTSPGDEEATDSLDKYGGLEDLTIETIANDDMRQVRRIPQKLGQAARDTLYNTVWNTTIKDNATASYDSVALYDAGHGNTGTDALDEAGLSAVRVAMRNQTEYGNQSGLPLGESNTPRTIAVPNELEIAAFKLTRSPVAVVSGEDATTPNFFNNALNVVVIDDWTDANNWFAFADPALQATLEVGFYQGREEPELFVQDAQNVGSMFTADKITYKVRHIWYVMVAEHRATYRQVVT